MLDQVRRWHDKQQRDTGHIRRSQGSSPIDRIQRWNTQIQSHAFLSHAEPTWSNFFASTSHLCSKLVKTRCQSGLPWGNVSSRRQYLQHREGKRNADAPNGKTIKIITRGFRYLGGGVCGSSTPESIAFNQHPQTTVHLTRNGALSWLGLRLDANL